MSARDDRDRFAPSIDDARRLAASECERVAHTVETLDPATARYLRSLPMRAWGIPPDTTPCIWEVMSRDA